MNRLNEIREYLINTEYFFEQMPFFIEPYDLAYGISRYAHRNQLRENGKPYFIHPYNCYKNYFKLIGYVVKIGGDLINPPSIDLDLLSKFNIPFKGVVEVCFLHDVLEDTDFTIEELEELFKECNYEEYFKQYIKDALLKVTHIESIPYDKYIDICMENPISALVKMMDLIDNSNALSLISFDNDKKERCKRYIDYIYIINNKYHFLENAANYKKELKKENN